MTPKQKAAAAAGGGILLLLLLLGGDDEPQADALPSGWPAKRPDGPPPSWIHEFCRDYNKPR